MPQPSVQQVHVDRLITQFAIRYAQDADVFLAAKVFPVVPVTNMSNYYLKFPKGYFMRDEMQVRPMGGRPGAAGYEVSHERYYTTEWSLEHRIDDRIRDNADEPIEPDLRAAELLTEQALIHRDREWVEAYFKEGVWATEWEGITGAESGKKFTRFSNYEAEGTTGYKSKPIKFFNERCREMREKTGRRPNKIVLGAKLYVVLINHPEIVQRVVYSGGNAAPAIVTPKVLAELFQVDDVMVAEAVYNSATEGNADTIEFIANQESALLCYAAPSPSIQRPSAGYTFAWTGRLPGLSNAFGGVIYRGREEAAHSDWYQILANYDMQQTASDLGMFIKTAI